MIYLMMFVYSVHFFGLLSISELVNASWISTKKSLSSCWSCILCLFLSHWVSRLRLCKFQDILFLLFMVYCMDKEPIILTLFEILGLLSLLLYGSER